MDPFDDLYARVIVEHALAVRAGQSVIIEGGELAEPLVHAVHRRVLEAGGHPAVQMLPDGWIEARAECASDEVLAEADPLKLAWYERVDCRVTLLALANVEQLAHVAPARAAASEAGRLRAVHVLVDRDARGEAVWCGAQYPTSAFAQAAGLSLEGYRELLARALKLDQPDPVVAWRAQGELQDRLVQRLEQVDELRVVAEGTDLRLRVGGRRWISASGRHNLPDGEVFTGPRENATEGVVTFAMPSSWGGQRVEGARLRFEAGRCVDAEAASGQSFLRAALETDEGARTLGEFAFGLNEAILAPTLDTLLDEKIGGTVHMALGASYAVTGGTNKSALHWDLVCDLRNGGEVYADGALIQRDGRFLGDFRSDGAPSRRLT
jgi:aminopeptidase